MTSFNFDDAVEAVRSGQDLSTITKRLVEQLDVSEKLSILTGPLPFWPGLKDLFSGGLNQKPYILGPIDRLNIPGIRFCDGPRGVVLGKATCFPIAMARGATWDVELEEKVGNVIATECRANGVNTFGAPCINLPRHPAWGRIQETYGEDPVLLGEFGLAMTRGLQQNGVMACVKHFALNSMENARFHVDVSIDDAALYEVYLAHFEMVVKEGPAMSVMSAYNSVNGEWCGQSNVLLNEVLRNKWGFQHFVISDWVFGLRDSALSLKNGLDLEAPFSQIRTKLKKQLDTKKFSIEDVDRSVSRLISTQILLYSQRKTSDPSTDVILCQDHRNLAQEVASRSMVLLKNEKNKTTGKKLLPLDAATIKKCVVIGTLADDKNTGDRGSSHVNSPEVATPYEGIKTALPHATVKLVASNSAVEASNAAKDADIAIVVVGYGAMDEGENLSANNPNRLIPIPSPTELVKDVPVILYQQAKERLGLSGDSSGPSMGSKAGGDRKSLRLSSKHIELIRAVRKVNTNTLVAIVASGAVIMEEWIDDVETVLMNWYSGCEGGHALADVVFGRYDASGRLPFSIPRSEDDLPFFDASTKKITYDKWYGQRLLDRKGVKARFPLGYGCSYTSFELDRLDVQQQDTKLNIQVQVKNVGERAGRHVVQVYGLPKNADMDFPARVLLGFHSIGLNAGESQMIKFQARTQPLHRWQNGRFVLSSNEIEVEVGAFAGDRSLTAKMTLV